LTRDEISVKESEPQKYNGLNAKDVKTRKNIENEIK
jgi:hypothetical protein